MTPEVAKELSVITNSKPAVDALILYANDRIDLIRKEYDLCNNLEEVKALQGQIREVKKLLTLREAVNKELV